MAAEDGLDRVVAGRYALRRCLGRGGMGTVWLATDGLLGRDVAVKEITFPASLTHEERRSLRERTLREARAAARFEHAQVTTVHDVVEEDGKPWIVMEHVPSRTLSDLVREQGSLPVDQVGRIGLDVLAALSAAHRAGIVHRDVKPANVLIGEQGRAWLTDFGIATSTGEEHLTGHGMLLGSPPYIAPERARGDEPGPAADLWALGATLFTATEGSPPFERGDPMATLLAVTTEEPPRATHAGPLEPLLRALLTRDPAQRMTAEQARSALTDMAGSDMTRSDVASVPASPAQVPTSAAEDRRRGPERAVTATRRGTSSGAGRRDDVHRIDLNELASLAGAATKAVAGSAARKVARRSRAPDPHALPEPQPRPSPPLGRKRPAARPPQDDGRRPWRFKRRWVVVPTLLSLALILILLVAAGLIVQALVHGG